ncbi:adenine deaminase [Anaerovibrio slackiae]|uniref:adenine deaminase n=1 Tax=Anaerovibrio slackiae TaxID=2652309 RepID=UPI00386D3175
MKRLIRVAQGLEPADLVLKNAEVFHVFTGEFIQGDIAIADGYIAGTGSYFGIEEIDMSGRYIVPGLIDAHVHIESSMLTPYQFAKAALPCGVTTVITDPHEIANVCGTKGIQFMLDATEKIPLNVYVMLPSCVPSTEFENAGAKLLADDLEPFLQHSRVLGLAEMMNAPGVLTQDSGVMEKLRMARSAGMHVDGHAPGLTSSQLMGYAAAGITSDHECITKEQALDRLRAGIGVMLREGTAAKNLKALLPAVNPDTAPYFMFCSDDKIPAELLESGYINDMIRIAVSEGGVSVANALQMATINTARHYNLKDVGAIMPGCKADLLVLDSLNPWVPLQVYKDGRLAYDQGRLVQTGTELDSSDLEHTVNVGELSLESLRLPLATEMAHVIGLVPYQIVTKKATLPVKRVDGCAVSDIENDVLKLAVFERHRATGNVGLGLVKGFGLKRGALASTVAHDSHNLIVIGTNDEDMLAAARELQRIGGGICIADGGEITASLALPVGGLMTNEPAQAVADKQAEIIAKAREMGVPEFYSPFLTLAFLSLPVIPSLKLTDKGLVDVDAFKFIPLGAK